MSEPAESPCIALERGPRRLLAALLLDAVAHLHDRGSKAAAEAERWIRAPHASWAPVSFAMVCEALGLDPAYLASGLLNRRADSHEVTRVPRRRTVAVEPYRRITLTKPRRRRPRPRALAAIQSRLSSRVTSRSPMGV